ncbi:MAG: NUDIX hydrolase [Myxococcota bacterium]|nr:NUDIX hydrolase [Myxococcota bacterium]
MCALGIDPKCTGLDDSALPRAMPGGYTVPLERQYLMGYTYKYPRPMVTVDAVVFRRVKDDLELLVIRRKNPPYQGSLALPGGFVDMHEDLRDAACRELYEETGLNDVMLEQLAAFGTPGRDPRGRNIAIAYVGVVGSSCANIQSGDDAAAAYWMPVTQCSDLAFDHDHILAAGLRWLERRPGGD